MRSLAPWLLHAALVYAAVGFRMGLLPRQPVGGQGRSWDDYRMEVSGSSASSLQSVVPSKGEISELAVAETLTSDQNKKRPRRHGRGSALAEGATNQPELTFNSTSTTRSRQRRTTSAGTASATSPKQRSATSLPGLERKQSGTKSTSFNQRTKKDGTSKNIDQGGSKTSTTPLKTRASPATASVTSKKNKLPFNVTKPEIESKPWQASYRTSYRSQQRIQQAGRATSPTDRPQVIATRVLVTLLEEIPSTECNAANVVCALTLSAKVMASTLTSTHPLRRNSESTQSNGDDQLRQRLFQIMGVVQHLLKARAFTARQLCNVAWAVAKHYDRDDQLLPTATSRTALSQDGVVGRAEVWDLNSSPNSLPYHQQVVDQTIDDLSQQLLTMLSKDLHVAKEGELCMAVWAYAILRRRRRPPGWEQEPQFSTPTGTANDVSSITTSLQENTDFIRFEQWNQGRPSPSTLSTNDSVRETSDQSPTDALFNLAGEALCQVSKGSTPNADVTDTSRLRISSCRWSELANVAWAFACHGQANSPQCQDLLSAIAEEATRRLKNMSDIEPGVLSRDLAQLIWALGTLQSDNFRLADSLVEFACAVSESARRGAAICTRLNKWSCADLVQVASSLAHARLDDVSLLESLYKESLRRLGAGLASSSKRYSKKRETFWLWEVSVLLWAQARLNLRAEQGDIFPSFAKQAVRSIYATLRGGTDLGQLGIGEREQANLAWSIAVLEVYDTVETAPLLDAIFQSAAAGCKRDNVIQLEHAHQLWQAFYLFQEECPPAVKRVPTWFRDCLKEKWLIEKSRTKISSARHKALSKTLKLMGVAHYNEHDEDIDVAIVLKPQASWTHQTEWQSSTATGVKVAVEFDGPNHFTRQKQTTADGSKVEPPRPLGHSVLKYRLLRRQGWTVVRVPYYEFDKIPFWASMERQRYLQRLLKTHGNLQFSAKDLSEYKAQVPNRESRFD